MAGSTKISDVGLSYNVTSIVPHHLYNRNTKEYNFVLLKLSAPLNASENIGVIGLPKYNDVLNYGAPCSMAGWGNLFWKQIF